MDNSAQVRQPKFFMYEASRGEVPAYEDRQGHRYILNHLGEWRYSYDPKFHHESRFISESEFHAVVKRQGANPPQL